MKNYYEMLELSQNASEETIKKVYKMHIKKNHPDLYQGEEKVVAEEKLKELNEAYEILVDKSKRKEYDNELSEFNTQDNEILAVLQQENNYLKEVINKKDAIIQEFLEEDKSPYINHFADEIEAEKNIYMGYDKKDISEVDPEEYSKRTYMTPTLGKILNIVILVSVLGVILYFTLGINIFKILMEIIINIFTIN